MLNDFRAIFLLLLAGLFFVSCGKSEKEKLQIEPVANLEAQAGLANDITYYEVNGQELKLDVIVPRTYLGEDPWWQIEEQKKPALLYIHGGGWVEGEKETRLMGLLPFVSRNWVVVNINYRLARDAKAPAAVVDCLKALDWMYANAETYQIDTTRIVVAGESAGGHLALMTGMLEKGDNLCDGRYIVNQHKKIAAIINWFGVTDFNLIEGFQDHEWFDPNDDWEKVRHSLSPITYVHEGNPPIISIHGSADPLVSVRHAEVLHESLDDHGVRNQLIVLSGRKHGDFSGEERTMVFEEIWKFLSDI